MTLILRSERVLTGTSIAPADVVIEHDRISALAPFSSAGPAYDFGRKLIAPGMIDLHSDAVEKEIEPRPGAVFPIDHALVMLDKKLAMTGITTMFHAIAFNEESLMGQRGNETAAAIIERIAHNNRTCLLVDNHVHARYEITSFTSLPLIKRFIGKGWVQLLSFMDHSPGQGQFRTLEKWKEYHMPVYELNEAQVYTVLDQLNDKKARCLDYLVDLSACARSNNVLLASHDDDTPEKVDFMKRMGSSISEFPLNAETAEYAKSQGIATGMGAPNVVRGRSQSGNISARELVNAGLCDFLCSDYHPSSMLQAVYMLHRDLDLGLAEAFSHVCERPAAIGNLDDRGRLEPGALADIIVIDDLRVPTVVLTVKSGNPVYSSLSCFCAYEDAA